MPGIGPGTPVRRSGVRIGQVTGLSLDDTTGQVRVQIAVEKPYTLHRDEVPTIVTGFLGGDANIDFLPKKPEPGQPTDRSPEPPGARFPAIATPTFRHCSTKPMICCQARNKHSTKSANR